MKTIMYGFVALVMGLMNSAALALSMERYVEGVHYVKVDGAQHMPDSVVEFFSFGCPHCYHLETDLEHWLSSKPGAVQFSRVPATWNSKFRQLAQAYYVIAALGLEEKAVPKVFHHIHKDKQTLSSASDLANLLQDLNVDPDQVEELWNSEAVATNLARAGQTFTKYQLRGVPAVVVNGQYKTTVRMAGSSAELFEVVNFLLGK